MADLSLVLPACHRDLCFVVVDFSACYMFEKAIFISQTFVVRIKNNNAEQDDDDNYDDNGGDGGGDTIDCNDTINVIDDATSNV